MREQVLRFGLHEGILVSIEDVPNGLSCQCVCPSCGADLIARKGNIRKHHFAHRGGYDCGHGCESALHLLAKKILEERKELYVPGETRHRDGQIIQFADVELESRRFPSFVPDVLLRNEDYSLCVEILVTHAVDEEKSKRIENAKVPTVEINLTDLIDNYDEVSVAKVLNSGIYTHWIYNDSFANELCDHLPCETRIAYGFVYESFCQCPNIKKLVSHHYSSHSCDCCQYYSNDRSAEGFKGIRPCVFREQKIIKQNVSDVKNLTRESGMIISVDVLVGNAWQHWAGNSEDLLSCDTIPLRQHSTNPSATGSQSIMGKTVSELWKPEYASMIVRRITDGIVMLINGENGEMKREGGKKYGRILGKYSRAQKGGGYRYSEDYVVWQADEPVWSLIWARRV